MNQLSETSLLREFIEEDFYQKARSSNIIILGARILTWECGWGQAHILRGYFAHLLHKLKCMTLTLA